jgi:arylsulfatase A-like enzyme
MLLHKRWLPLKWFPFLKVILVLSGVNPCNAQPPSPASSGDTSRPNIVFVLTDDMGYSDPGCYGGTFAPTPNIDKLASEGVRLTHFYDNAPICSASRAAFITGMFPARWNFTSYLSTRRDNLDAEQSNFLSLDAPAMARILKAAGYATAHFGKWHLGGGRGIPAPPFSAYGYDEHIGTWESPEPDPNITATGWIWSPKDPVKRWQRTAYFVDHALDFLKRHKGQPCYVEVWPDDVHTPWVPNLERETTHPNSDQEEDFIKVLAEYDRQMGRLFDGIKNLGLEQNTLVVFTSDNGPAPSFNHARTGGLRGGKYSLYEGGVRVPFIVRWPGHTIAGRVDNQNIVEAVDLFPTFCSVAHAPMPTDFTFDGQDMIQALVQGNNAAPQTIFWEYGRTPGRPFIYPRSPYDRSPNVAVREGKWKLLVNADGTSAELYDLETDPKETTNLASQQLDTTERLREAALAWRRSLPKLPISPADAKPGPEP